MDLTRLENKTKPKNETRSSLRHVDRQEPQAYSCASARPARATIPVATVARWHKEDIGVCETMIKLLERQGASTLSGPTEKQWIALAIHSYQNWKRSCENHLLWLEDRLTLDQEVKWDERTTL